MKKIRDTRSATKWFRDNVKGWDENKVVIFYKSQQFHIIFVEQGNLRVLETYDSGFPILAPKFEEYFETGIFDNNIYYKMYIMENGERLDVSANLCFSSIHNMFKFLGNYRQTVNQAVGILEIPKPDHFVKEEESLKGL